MSDKKPEKWKDIDGFKGKYQISNHGRIKSLGRWIIRINRNMFLKEKIMSLNYTNRYILAGLYNGEKKISRSIHRLVAEAFISNPDNKPSVNHKDGNKYNNYVENLEWVTDSENAIHAHANGLSSAPYGEKCGTSKLTDKDVTEIKRLLSEQKLLQREIGDLFGVRANLISRIKTGVRWPRHKSSPEIN